MPDDGDSTLGVDHCQVWGTQFQQARSDVRATREGCRLNVEPRSSSDKPFKLTKSRLLIYSPNIKTRAGTYLWQVDRSAVVVGKAGGVPIKRACWR